jgi:hypothetical protein
MFRATYCPSSGALLNCSRSLRFPCRSQGGCVSCRALFVSPVSFVKAAVYLCVTRWCRSFRLFTSVPRNCSAITGFWLSGHNHVPPHKVTVGILRHPIVLSCLATSHVFGNDRILLLHAAFIHTCWRCIHMAVQNDVIST